MTASSPPLPTRPPRSLQSRVLWAVLSVVGVLWLVVAAATWWDTRHELDELLDAHLSQAASLLVSQPLDDLGQLARTDAPSLHEYQTRVVLQVWHQGRLLVRSDNAPVEALAPATQRGFSDAVIGGEAWRVFSTPGRDAHVVIQVAEQEAARAEVLMASLRSVAGPMAVAFPLLGLAIWWAVRQAVKPLVALGQQVAQRRPGELAPLPTRPVPLEAQPLVLALNRLFDRTSALIDAERRFTADAAHELRTPLAAIRMQAQVAQGALNDAERTEALTATLQGCDRATHLVEQLLQLARLEVEPLVQPEHTDLQACVATVLADLRHSAARRGQTLEWTPPADQTLWVTTPAGLTRVLLRNLLDNALRYSPDGAAVRLVASPVGDGGSTRLSLHDSGPGLSEADMQRLGERFFRVLGTGQSGSGLGWSIVTRIARLYGLQTTVVRSAELGGLEVTLVW